MMTNKNKISPNLWISLNSIIVMAFCFIPGAIIPNQFLRDSLYYHAILSSSISGFSGPVNLIGAIYAFIGINAPGLILQLVSTAIFIVNAYLIYKIFELQFVRISQYFASAFSLVLIPFYASGYSKELLVALTNITILLLVYKIKRIEFLAFPLISILIGLMLRPYYFLTLIFFIFVFLIIKYVRNFLLRLICIIFLLSSLITFEFHTKFLQKVTGFDILNVRSNSQTILKLAARSQIEHVETNGNFLHNSFSVVQIIWSMIFPYNEISLTPYVLGVLGINLLVWVIVFRSLQLKVCQDNSRNLPIASFIIAFSMTGTFFEVDAGSFLRHFYPFMPLGAIILQSTRSRYGAMLLKNASTWWRV